MLVFARVFPAAYDAAVQEDRLIEWWTAALFAGAGAVRLIAALRTRRVFDALVALFCIFVAGEEISWGQRLLGFTPPDYFLAHNTQQEFSLHNFADVFGKPKSVLMLALTGFGIGLPLVALAERGRALLQKVGARAPALTLLPWFAAAVAMLAWYPIAFTGEWVETLAGSLFLVSAPVQSTRALGRAMAATIVIAVALSAVSNVTATARAPMVACAQAEADALLQDIAGSLRSYDGVVRHNIHKRFHSAVEDNYFYTELAHFKSVRCADDAVASAARRRQFAIDPWGLAYWVRSARDDAGTTITVYSFGPNRRRDNEPGERIGDDVLRVGRVQWLPNAR